MRSAGAVAHESKARPDGVLPPPGSSVLEQREDRAGLSGTRRATLQVHRHHGARVPLKAGIKALTALSLSNVREKI